MEANTAIFWLLLFFPFSIRRIFPSIFPQDFPQCLFFEGFFPEFFSHFSPAQVVLTLTIDNWRIWFWSPMLASSDAEIVNWITKRNEKQCIANQTGKIPREGGMNGCEIKSEFNTLKREPKHWFHSQCPPQKESATLYWPLRHIKLDWPDSWPNTLAVSSFSCGHTIYAPLKSMHGSGEKPCLWGAGHNIRQSITL